MLHYTSPLSSFRRSGLLYIAIQQITTLIKHRINYHSIVKSTERNSARQFEHNASQILTLLSLVCAMVCLVISSPELGAQQSTAQSINIEQVRRAMRDELKRSMEQLTVASLKKPYYIEYTLTLRSASRVKAVLGSLLESSSVLIPRLTVGIRVGSPEFDNTNFFDVGLSFFGSSDDEESFKNRRVPIEANYDSFRRDLWLASDAAYKQAVELYAKKEATIKNRSRLDTTVDFVLLPPTIEIDTQPQPAFNKALSEDITLAVSKVFANYSAVELSSVTLEYLPETVIYVNSEGREYVKSESQCGFEVMCSSQTTDGMPLAQSFTAYTLSPNELPSKDSLIRGAEQIAELLTKQLSTKVIEPYSGPVLFEGQAAAECFAQLFAPQLCAQRQPLTDRGVQDNERFTAFQNKIGARVLPEYLSVISDPNQKSIVKTPVCGTYTLDDEGFKPSKLTVVDKGYLKSLFTSRVPTRRLKQTNARQRGGAPMYDVLTLTCNDKKNQLDKKKMLARMVKILKDRDLPFGYIVKSALNQNLLYTTLYALTSGDFPYSLGETTMNLLAVYKVYPDGREELVRGVQAVGMNPSVFKDILAVGTTTYVHNLLAGAVTSPYVTGGAQYLPTTVSVPDLLFEDIELKPLDGDFPKPPFLPSPLAGK